VWKEASASSASAEQRGLITRLVALVPNHLVPAEFFIRLEIFIINVGTLRHELGVELSRPLIVIEGKV
jgi:hypothetical protein